MRAATGFTVLSLTNCPPGKLFWELDERLAQLRRKKIYKVIADLTGIAHISSAVLGLLTRFAEECREHAGELRLVVTEQGVLNLLQVTMLDKVLEVFGTVEEAQEESV